MRKENLSEIDQYKRFSMEVAKWLVEFVVWEYPEDIQRQQLLLDVIRKEMERAYANIYLDYSEVAKSFEIQWQNQKADLIKKCLELCSDKFWKWVGSLTITDTHVIFKNSQETIIQSKQDIVWWWKKSHE